ncbi:MAG: YHS domain-containing protein [Flavobacteriales bacterium]|jgi:YHS domain-containing protein
MNIRAFVLLLSLLSPSIFAADPPYNSNRNKGAIRGYDPVAYFDLEPGAKAVKGRAKYAYIWKGVRWNFATQDNLRKFQSDPDAYAPQYGGYCAFAVGKGFTTSIRPNSWQIHDGKLYLNYNDASLKLFNKNIEGRIVKASSNWPEVLKNCEKHRNCRKPQKLD